MPIIILLIALFLLCMMSCKETNHSMGSGERANIWRGLEGITHFAEYKQKIIDQIPESAAAAVIRILDCACGTGATLQRLSISRPDCQLFGFDINKTSTETARNRVPTAEIKEASIFEMPYSDGEFDVVMIERVLEHFGSEQVTAATKEMARVCKPGGIMIITEPDWTAVKYDAGCSAEFLKDAKWCIASRLASIESPKIGTLIADDFPGSLVIYNPLKWTNSDEFVHIFGDIYSSCETFTGELGVNTIVAKKD